MIIPLMAAELFGLARMGRVMGIVLTADGVAEAVVPMTVATLRDRTGSYTPGFTLLVGLAALGAVAVALLPSRRAAGRGRPAPEPATAGFTIRLRTGQNVPVAGHTRPSVNKRLREADKKEKQAAKAERRAQRAEERSRSPEKASDDPDIAGIVPGPQPLPWDESPEPSLGASVPRGPSGRAALAPVRSPVSLASRPRPVVRRSSERGDAMNEDLLARAARVQLLLMDVDGVMTDGSYWNVPDGNGGFAEIKAFDSQDGIALQWLKRVGIKAGLISGRVSVATEERARSRGLRLRLPGAHREDPDPRRDPGEVRPRADAGRLHRRRLHGRRDHAPRRPRRGHGERQARGQGRGALRDRRGRRPRRRARGSRAAAEGTGTLGRDPPSLRGPDPPPGAGARAA